MEDDFWAHIDAASDIAKPLLDVSCIAAPRCSDCDVELHIGYGTAVCPSCSQTVDFDMGHTAPTPQHTVVVTRDGAVRAFGKVENNRAKQLLGMYETFLKRNNSLVFPTAILATAVEILLQVQEVSTANRGGNLAEIMAGCLYIATLQHKMSVTETTIAKIFNTRNGLSRGKNSVVSMLSKRLALHGGEVSAYLRKKSGTLFSRFLCEAMVLVGFEVKDRRLKLFIKCLCFIEECFGYIDTQIFCAKVAGAIVFYLINRTSLQQFEPTVANITVVVRRLGVSYETMRKIYKKLEYANGQGVIRRIAAITKIDLKPVITSL